MLWKGGSQVFALVAPAFEVAVPSWCGREKGGLAGVSGSLSHPV